MWRLLLATVLGCSLLGLAAQRAQAVVFLSQNFDTDPLNYTHTPFFIQDQGPNPGTRYFNLSNAAGIVLNPGITGATGNYVAVQDADTTVAPVYTTFAPPTLTFDNVNVGLSTNLQLSIGLAGLPNVEPENYIRAQVDTAGNGIWTNLFNFQGAGAAYTNGTQTLTGAFRTFTYPMPAPTDGVLRLRILSYNDTDSLNEASGYDNIVVTGTPVFGTLSPNVSTHFTEPAVGARNYQHGANLPGIEMGFTTTGGPPGVTEFSGGDKQFKVSAATTSFRSEFIDLRTSGAVSASIDLRAYVTAASGFETSDFLNAFVEVSTDGLFFTKINFFDAHGDSNGLVDGALDLLELGGTNGSGINTPFTHFSLTIPAEIATMRFGVDASSDSTFEVFLFDNLSVSVVPEPSSIVLAGLGLICMLPMLRRKQS